MLKKHTFFSTVVILSAMALLAAPSLKASSDSNEPIEKILCDNSVSACYNLFEINLLTTDLLYKVQSDNTFLEETVSYLAQHEKSPPVATI